MTNLNWANPSLFRLLLPASEPPTLDAFLSRFPMFTASGRTDGVRWQAVSRGPIRTRVWCENDPAAGSGDIIRWAPLLSDIERDGLGRARSRLMVEVDAAGGSVLRARKDALREAAKLFELAGLALIDVDSFRIWTPGGVEDEFLHDADLDIESLYVIHAVSDDDGRPSWIHTHGLAALGGFDVDILEPRDEGYRMCPTIIRALGYAMIAGNVVVDEPEFPIAAPDGTVRLVPAREFDQRAPKRFRDIRDMNDPAHTENRAVICDVPARKRFSLGAAAQPIPVTFLREWSGNKVVHFGKLGTELMTRRAQDTAAVMEQVLREFEEFEFQGAVKLGYEVDSGTGREHLWFDVHGIADGLIDATLVNQPFNIASMNEGDRGTHPIERVSDWSIRTPLGTITPRNMSLVRLLETHREEILKQIRDQRG